MYFPWLLHQTFHDLRVAIAIAYARFLKYEIYDTLISPLYICNWVIGDRQAQLVAVVASLFAAALVAVTI